MADRITVVGFGTAHATGLTVLGVLALHYSSTLGGFLGSVGTVQGSLLFGILWGVTVTTHRYGFESVDPWSVDDRKTAIRFIGAGFVWGALTGIGTFWGLVTVGILAILLSNPTAVVELLAVPPVFIALVGTVLSLAIGGVVGIVGAVFDVGVISVAERFVGR